MYQLTEDEDVVLCTVTDTWIPRGHRLWVEYEAWVATGNTPLRLAAAPTLAEARAARQADATTERWSQETGGIELGGVRVGTTLDDQNRISGVLAAISLGGLQSVDFKAASGWVQLSAEEIQGIAQAISGHVQACFSAERAHHEAIDRLTSAAQIAAYDVTQGWPG